MFAGKYLFGSAACNTFVKTFCIGGICVSARNDDIVIKW